MEFYHVFVHEPTADVIVSIPNGMEFYAGSKEKGSSIVVFQFPTGWNSTLVAPVRIADDVSFNSQRDGILREVFQYIRTFEPQFQFPTGWNST